MASSINPHWATSAIVRDQEQDQPPVAANAQQVEHHQSLVQTTSSSQSPQEAHPSLYASSRGNNPAHPSLRDFRGTPPLNSGGESSSWHEQYPKGLYIGLRDYASYRSSSVSVLAATAKRHEPKLAWIYIFAHQTDGMAHFMYQKRPKPAFFIYGEHATLLHEYFSSQRERRTLKAHIGYGYSVVHLSGKDWPFLCMFDRRLVPAMIASERHLYESNGLPKEASEEQINDYMESLLTSNIAMMADNTIMHGHLAGYGLENAEKSEEWGKSDDPDKRAVDSPPSLHHLGTVNTALAARQIEMAMPPHAVKPFWFRAWDSDATTRIIRDSVEAAFAINEELAEAYNKKRETDPDEAFADFLMDYGLTKLFDES